jgi:sulfite exporter TauE/SafE
MNPLVMSAFAMGLFGGVHCVAMCGGVVGMLCSAAPRCPHAATRERYGAPLAQIPHWLAYNVGRIASYTLLGVLFGALGTLSTGVFPLDGLRFALRALAALCMLAVGLHLAGLPSIVKRLESLGAPMWRKISPLAKRFMPLRTPWQALALGAVWGLMPCGLLYGALALAASAESPALGGLTMAAFGVATLPVMLTMSALAQSVARWLAQRAVKRAAGLVFLAFGLWNTAGVAAQTGVAAFVGVPPARHHCCPTPRN